jgi:hypothetical protein
MDPATLAELEAPVKALYQSQYPQLPLEYTTSLVSAIQFGITEFTLQFPSDIIPNSDFPLFVTWYLRDNNITGTPFFILNDDNTLTLQIRP